MIHGPVNKSGGSVSLGTQNYYSDFHLQYKNLCLQGAKV